MKRVFGSLYKDVALLAGCRTGFADYNSVLREISPTDLGIKVARAVLALSGVSPSLVDAVIAGNMAQSSFDAYYLPRHIGLYSGLDIDVPAHLVHRLCGTGFDVIMQAADAITLGKGDLLLGVGAESMSRNPIAAYTHRSGFKMGQLDFKDFLWEATLDTAFGGRMGDTAENLAKEYGINREEVDLFAAESFARAVVSGEFRAGEIVSVVSEVFKREGFKDRGIRLPRGVLSFAEDEHVKPTSLEVLARLKPAFGGVQTGGNSSAIVDGAAACLIGRAGMFDSQDILGWLRAGVAVGVPPAIMGIGPAPAIRALLGLTGLSLDQIDRFEINEAFGAQYLAVEKELGLDRARVNVNGGAIAIGHPLGVSGLRLTISLARELKRIGGRYGIASACAGGGQGVALLIENI